MPVPSSISELRDRFDLRAFQLNEADVRGAFIDPLFQLLGWDLYDQAQVRRERKTHAGRPDYMFALGNRVRFIVEAKAPSENIETTARHALQLRRYAWNTDNPVCVLTNFRQFAVFDCRVKPSANDAADTARTMYVPLEKLEEEWPKISALFSHKSVSQGALEPFREDKKGHLRVNDALLKDIDEWRRWLAHSIANRNRLNNRDLSLVVQRTIDRILFLRICEDRGIEPEGQLRHLIDRRDVYRHLCYLFEEADARYNSGLFHFRREKARLEEPDDVSLQLVIDDETLQSIIKGLYLPHSPYDFSVLPADILGQVYEQFLGKEIILSKNGEARVYDKPQVKKAGGVFYTPTQIVERIVSDTLEPLLNDVTLSDVSCIKVVDPACGSGSFLIVAYQHFIDWYLAQYTGASVTTHKKDGRIFKDERELWSLTVPERKRILVSHIFGVDVDPQAVEVTKLSLLLKVIEGESDARQRKIFQERAIPDLAANIKWGNSVVEPDFQKSRQSTLFGDEERNDVIVFNWKDEFPTVFGRENSGFDAVVGNPPYVTYSLGRGRFVTQEEREIEYLRNKYPESAEYKLNSFALFFQRGLQVANDRGVCAFIVPGTILINQALTKIRHHLLTQSRLSQIVSLNYRVFKGADMGDCAILVARKPPARDYSIEVSRYDSDDWSAPAISGTIQARSPLELDENRLYVRPFVYEVLKLGLGKGFKLLGDASVARFYNGIKTGDNKRFISDTKVSNRYLPVIRGRDFDRYSPAEPTGFVLFDPKKLWSNTDTSKLGVKDKILIRQTGDTLTATLDPKGYYCMDTVHMIYSTSLERMYLLALLNSRLLNFYHSCLVPEQGKTFAEVKIANLQKLPIPILPRVDPRHSELCELAKTQLDIHRATTRTSGETDQVLLRRRAADLDRRIDAIVYGLYQLTKEQVSLVEAGPT